MGLTLDEKKAILNYRIQKAEKALVEAMDNANLEHWNLVANRLYYAVFYMASALLIDKGFTAKSHNGVFCILGQEFIRKDLLNREDAKLASRLQNMRQSGDYDDMFDWTEEDVLPLFDKTKELIQKNERINIFTVRAPGITPNALSSYLPIEAIRRDIGQLR